MQKKVFRIGGLPGLRQNGRLSFWRSGGVGAWICRKSSNIKGLAQIAVLEICCVSKDLAYPCTNAAGADLGGYH
jgi:hypothetical protein